MIKMNENKYDPKKALHKSKCRPGSVDAQSSPRARCLKISMFILFLVSSFNLFQRERKMISAQSRFS